MMSELVCKCKNCDSSECPPNLRFKDMYYFYLLLLMFA